MAINIPQGKHAVLEINKLESRTTGAMVADRPTTRDLDNGTIVYYSATEIGVAKNEAIGCGLVYNTEHMYDERAKDLASYYTKKGEYARVYNFGPTDVITTNAVDPAAFKDGVDLTFDAATGKFVEATSEAVAIAKGYKSDLPSGEDALKIYFILDNADVL